MTGRLASLRHRIDSGRLPALTLRRRLILAFVLLVTVAIALVGGISYSATVATFHSETDSSLISAAAALATGGALPQSDDRQPERGRGARGRDADDAAVTLVLRIAPDGSVTTRRGPWTAPQAADMKLAAMAAAGSGRLGQRAVGGTQFRTYTLALGNGRGAILVGSDLGASARLLGRIALNTMLIGIGVIILAALVGWWIARQITRRLGALSLAAETVATTGDLSIPIVTTGRDEVASLATSLRTMLGQLAQSRDAQRQLIEDAGHELRTPLTSLRTNAQVMRRFEQLDAADRLRLLGDVDTEIEELTALTNELVELATDTRAGEQAERRDIGDLVAKVAARIHRRYGREIRVTADHSERVVQPGAIERAVGNLLENAVKFDPDGAEPIEVTVADGTISVADRGPGVPGDELGVVFDRFHRSATARSLPGSGLGLAIVRDIAERHGGTALAENRPGGGLTVTIVLG